MIRKTAWEDTFTVTLRKQKMIADIVKETRTRKGYTQKELSDISKISLRSIQRIENEEVVPRMYTLKTLADCLDFSLDFLHEEETTWTQESKWNTERKIILTVGSGALLFILAWAYKAQSGSFPETDFELLVYCAFTLAIYMIFLLKVWRPNS